MKVQSGQKATVWFIVGFLVVATVAIIIAAAVSGGDTGGVAGQPAPAVSADDHTQGPLDAPVSIIEYGDFQCPACANYHSLVKRILEDYGDQVVFAYRDFPLHSIHPNAGISAQAAEAAGLQGKYWEMYDLLFENQRDWADVSPRRVVEEHFNGYAESLGLDMERFARDINSDEVRRAVEDDVDSGNSIGVNSTPSFYVNQEKIQNPRSYDQFRAIIDAALESA